MKLSNALIFSAILLVAAGKPEAAVIGIDEANPSSTALTEKPTPGSFLGTVESVEPTTNLVHVSDVNGKVSSLECGGLTRIKRQGTEIALSELQPGDKVSFTRDNGGAITNIEVR